MRLALEPLARLADETGAALVGVIHVAKGMTKDPLTAVMGSRGFVALARAVLFVAVDPDDRTRRILSQVKCNVGRDDSSGLESLSYRIEPATVETTRGPAQSSRIVWTGTSAKGVREILAADGERAGARQVASDWLTDLLADGPMPSEDVKEAAAAAGLSWGTVRRAQEDLGIKPTKAGGRFGGDPHWYWELPTRKPRSPEDAQPPPEDAHPTECASSGKSEHLQAEDPQPHVSTQHEADPSAACGRDLRAGTAGTSNAVRDDSPGEGQEEWRP